MSVSLNSHKVWKPKSTGQSGERITRNKPKTFFQKIFQFVISIPQGFTARLPKHAFFQPFNSKHTKTFENSRRIKPGDKEEVQYKVFQPPKETVKKELRTTKPTKKVFQFGFKSIHDLKQDYQKITPTTIKNNINYVFVKLRIIERFNLFMLYACVSVLIFFFVYLSLFDTFFLVKNYDVNFATGSYMSQEDTSELIREIRNRKLFGIIPNNQFWFLNSQNLTLISKSHNSQIVSVDITQRQWPNRAELLITTKPILITLGINNNEYWRISQDGEVLSKDEVGLYEQLVLVESRVEFNIRNKTLQDYSFRSDRDQLNRFWFVIWLKNELEQLGIDIDYVSFPSLFDTDVKVYTVGGTILMFNSTAIDKLVLKRRVEILINERTTEFNSNVYDYIDFRIPRRVYICRQNTICDEHIN